MNILSLDNCPKDPLYSRQVLIVPTRQEVHTLARAVTRVLIGRRSEYSYLLRLISKGIGLFFDFTTGSNNGTFVM